MPTTGVAQWTCAVSNLGFIYIYGWPCMIGLRVREIDEKREETGGGEEYIYWHLTNKKY